MRKILSYFKGSVAQIIVIVLLLVLQAMCDLTIPQYTSDVVNIGIQQGGITSPVPSVIRESQMKKLLLFTSEEEKKLIEDSYKIIEKNDASHTKKYPALKKEAVYELKENADKKELETPMGKAMLMTSSMEGDSKQAKEMQAKFKQGLPDQMQDMDIFLLLSQMPEEQSEKMMQEINKQLDKMPESIVTQSGIAVAKAEYEAVGVNTDAMQNRYILITGVKMLALALIVMVSAICAGYLSSKVAAKLGRDLRSGIFKKVVSFSNAEFDKFSTASLITRSTNDIQQVQMLTVMILRMVMLAPIMGIGGIVKALETNVSMAWVIALAVIVIIGIVILLFSITMPRFKSMQKLVDRLNLVTREILTGLPVIRAFSTEKYEEERFDKANRDLTKVNLFVNRAMTFMMPFMMLMMNAIAVLVVWQGAKGIDAGNMQVGDLMAFIQYTMQIIMSFLIISMISIMWPRASVSAGRIGEILSSEVTIHDPEEDKQLLEEKKGYVEFEHVNFRYPNAEEDALSDITFTAKPGETTAIIGSTGSGKSTLVNLIPRFYDVTGGTIRIGGRDVKEVSQHSLRECLGFVPQKGVLFSGTIDSNLRYGKQEASEEELEKAARIAQAKEFIEEKPDKYNTPISQGGSNVSGGQKQRLSIARAIAKDPDIYVFDDSFSALDFKTDAVLRKTLKEEIKNRTMIIVAQRISTIMNAEQILVLDEGKIVGKGTHRELLQNCEVYNQIALSQLSKEELA